MLMPDPLPESERAAIGPAVVGSQGTITGDATPDRPPRGTRPQGCPICGVALKGRQTSACSDKHRAAWSRRRRAEVLTARERQVQTYLLTAQEALWAAQEVMKGR